MSIQAVSFGKTAQTKNGNKYEKAKAGGYAGLAAGVAVSAFNGTKAAKAVKNAMNATAIKNLYKETLSKLPSTGKALIKRFLLFNKNQFIGYLKHFLSNKI